MLNVVITRAFKLPLLRAVSYLGWTWVSLVKRLTFPHRIHVLVVYWIYYVEALDISVSQLRTPQIFLAGEPTDESTDVAQFGRAVPRCGHDKTGPCILGFCHEADDGSGPCSKHM